MRSNEEYFSEWADTIMASITHPLLTTHARKQLLHDMVEIIFLAGIEEGKKNYYEPAITIANREVTQGSSKSS